MFFTFFKLHKWYQIAQSVTFISRGVEKQQGRLRKAKSIKTQNYLVGNLQKADCGNYNSYFGKWHPLQQIKWGSQLLFAL